MFEYFMKSPCQKRKMDLSYTLKMMQSTPDFSRYYIFNKQFKPLEKRFSTVLK